MFYVCCRLDFCYGHRLLNHAGKCRFLHGHNGRAEITVGGEQLNSFGMVMDFADIKRDIKVWIEDHLDHRMILHNDDPAVPWMRSQEEPVYVVSFNPTAENIARHIYEQALAKGIPVQRVRLWETPKCHATFQAKG